MISNSDIQEHVERSIWEIGFYLSNLNPFELPSIEFKRENFRRLPSGTSAVYFILSRDKPQVLYIGKAHDLKWRFKTSEPHSCLDRVGEYGSQIALAWWKQPKPLITTLESLLIHSFQPVLNRRERYSEIDYAERFKEVWAE